MSRERSLARGFAILSLTLPLVLSSVRAFATTRDETISRAKSFAFHPWTCSTENLTGSCGSGYQSVYSEGDYLGLPYDWGGYMSLFEFDQAIESGYAAGSYDTDGILSCTVGLDCSGFVTQAWKSGHYSTSYLDTIASPIDLSDILPGDAFNQAGYHVALYSHTLGSGEPFFYEAAGYNVHVNTYGGWSYVTDYVPVRYENIEGDSAATLYGSVDNPFVVDSFPYVDSQDTKESLSDALDGCALSPGSNESGPEYIYEVTITEPGQLTASIADDAGVDIDLHLYTSMNANDCIARDDSAFTESLDCGTYYIVADTFHGTKDLSGHFTLTVDFAPSGQSCGSGPPGYSFNGEVGDPCAYSGDPTLPFCNPNLGADTCVYSDSPPTSFCSKPCVEDSDCYEFESGCCSELGPGEFYCLAVDFCPSQPDGTGGADSGSGGNPSEAGGGGAASDAPGPQTTPVTGGASSDSGGSNAESKAVSGASPDESSGCNVTGDSDSKRGSFATLFLSLVILSARRRRAG